MKDPDEELIRQINDLVEEAMTEYVAIKGISIGTSLATNIFTKLSPELKTFSETELIASATSFQYIVKNLYEYIVSNKLKSTYVCVDEYILLMLIVKEISGVFILDRKLAELEGINSYQRELNNFILKIAAFVETSDSFREDPFVLIKRAIPSAFMIAIVTKEGMPIKVECEGVQEAMVASMVAAISNLTNVIMKKAMDYTVLQGMGGHIIVVQFDEKRILAITVPEEEGENIGQYLARIKEIIKQCNHSTNMCE